MDLIAISVLHPLASRYFRVSRPPLVAAILAAIVLFSTQPAAAQDQSKASLTAPLKRADQGETELHIFYVHGMGIDPPNVKAAPQDFQTSQDFRKSFCRLLECTTKMGEWQSRFYAQDDDFAPHAPLPTLSYLSEKLWATPDDWRAAAPFVDNYLLIRKKTGTKIYLHEINWWPLVFSAKCRQIVAKEAGLVYPDPSHIAVCSAPAVANQDGTFKSYPWITAADIQHPVAPWPAPAAVNRSVKRNIMDWGFVDALLAVGPLHQYLVQGIREVVLHSFTPNDKQEFVVVSHSLGSYLMFSALDLQNDAVGSHPPDWEIQFRNVLSRTSHAYFMANQVRILELANLDDSKGGNLTTHLANWSDLRAQAQLAPPQMVAFSDPGDLLTWQIPEQAGAKDANGNSVVVANQPAQNSTRWFWLIENPVGAHTKYVQNKHVVRFMIPKAPL